MQGLVIDSSLAKKCAAYYLLSAQNSSSISTWIFLILCSMVVPFTLVLWKVSGWASWGMLLCYVWMLNTFFITKKLSIMDLVKVSSARFKDVVVDVNNDGCYFSRKGKRVHYSWINIGSVEQCDPGLIAVCAPKLARDEFYPILGFIPCDDLRLVQSLWRSNNAAANSEEYVESNRYKANVSWRGYTRFFYSLIMALSLMFIIIAIYPFVSL